MPQVLVSRLGLSLRDYRRFTQTVAPVTSSSQSIAALIVILAADL